MLTVADVGCDVLQALLTRYALKLSLCPADSAIPGSFWGDSEAGIIASTVHVRSDTPVHSFLHETSHLICMSAKRRQTLSGNAGGSDLEEAAVCYLQILLADCVAGLDSKKIMSNMDTWGYSFRLGSTRAWFQDDAADAKQFLRDHGLIDEHGAPSFRLRDDSV